MPRKSRRSVGSEREREGLHELDDLIMRCADGGSDSIVGPSETSAYQHFIGAIGIRKI